ncbi:class I SAM-dependent methyltransferase [Nocardia sp. NPDC127579]|uniref:class I SAM-dependent methyltransferase n=1 Tax=Nocardia sp. NPDC127579 TaxID=3345402 RepID=UPI003635C4DC
MTEDYRTLNKANWDERAPAHAASPDYQVDRLRGDPEFLSEVVRFDLPLLGPVRGLDAVHLQCHIGTDTLSLARLGARMTGLDFSSASLAEARRLAEQTGTPIEFVESDVYEARTALGVERFDLPLLSSCPSRWSSPTRAPTSTPMSGSPPLPRTSGIMVSARSSPPYSKRA